MVTARILEPTPELQLGQPSASSMVLAYLRKQYSDADRLDAPALAAEAEARFAKDPAFIDALRQEFFGVTVYQLVRSWLAETRRPSKPKQTTNSSPLAIVQTRPSRSWAKFMEHTGNAYVRVLQMTRAELLDAAAIRRARAAVDAGYANTWERLAARLQRDDERVCDRWTVDEIADVYAQNGVTDEEQEAA